MKDNVVQVNLWDKNVGLLSWDDKRGCSVFQFEQDFMQYGWNIALYSEFDTLEDVKFYATHPDHVAAGKILAETKESRACVDYEL